MEPTEILIEALDNLRSGYAYDIITGILGRDMSPLRLVGKEKEVYSYTDQDADSLFRTLVLDHYYSVEQAERIYSAAMAVIADNEG